MKFRDLTIGERFHFDYDPMYGLNNEEWVKVSARKYAGTCGVCEELPYVVPDGELPYVVPTSVSLSYVIGSINARVKPVWARKEQ